MIFNVPFIILLFPLVIIMRKYYCLEEREAVLPDRSNKSRRKELGKVTDTVALKFDCPRIISNGNYKILNFGQRLKRLGPSR